MQLPGKGHQQAKRIHRGRLNAIVSAINPLVRLVGVEIQRYDTVLPTPWAHDPNFCGLLKQIEDSTLVTPDRCYMIYQLAKRCAVLSGAMAEVGVFRGGTAKLIGHAAQAKTLHLFDTFSGMPETNANVDLHKASDFSDTSLDDVQRFLEDCQNTRFHQGLFPQTTRGLEAETFCFVHCDVDIYQSVKDCLSFFYPRLVTGGVLIFDDYEWKHCPGVKQAIEEYLAGKPEMQIVTARYQCAIFKFQN